MNPDKLTIETPEQTSLQFVLAGIGSRFLAVAYDTCIQVIAFAVLGGSLLIFWAAAGRRGGTWALAIGAFLGFCLYYGYFAFFEAIWNGQTPGKRYAKVRVIKESGRPITVYEAIVRNLLRIVDQLPSIYAVGIITALLNKQNKRLGDFAAGTVVVHETPLEQIQPYWDASENSNLLSYNAAQLSLAEFELIETFLQRRSSLSPEVRRQMAYQIAQRIAETMNISREHLSTTYVTAGDQGGSGILGLPRDDRPSAEDFLEAIACKRRNPHGR